MDHIGTKDDYIERVTSLRTLQVDKKRFFSRKGQMTSKIGSFNLFFPENGAQANFELKMEIFKVLIFVFVNVFIKCEIRTSK